MFKTFLCYYCRLHSHFAITVKLFSSSVNNSTQCSPSWEADSFFLSSKEISCIFFEKRGLKSSLLKDVAGSMLINFTDVSGQIIVQTLRGILTLEDRTKRNKLLTNASQLPSRELVKTASHRSLRSRINRRLNGNFTIAWGLSTFWSRSIQPTSSYHSS